MIDRTTKSYILETTVREPRFQNRRGRIRGWLKKLAVCALVFLLAVGALRLLIPAVIDAADREAAWREDRLCRIYGVCDPKAGP